MPVTIAYSQDTGAWAGTYPTVRDSSTGCVIQVLWDQPNDRDGEIVVPTRDPDEQYPGVVGMCLSNVRNAVEMLDADTITDEQFILAQSSSALHWMWRTMNCPQLRPCAQCSMAATCLHCLPGF